MPRQFKEARQINKLKVTEAASKLGISQPTLSAWEGGRKSPSINNLENMADLYGVTTDFLLGRESQFSLDTGLPIPFQMLSILHGIPVWSAKYGWLLVDSIEKQLRFFNGQTISFSDTEELFVSLPLFSIAIPPLERPISKPELDSYSEIWLEPISTDFMLRDELRGWYRVKGRWVENDYGSRFFLDTYSAKWLAFKNKFPNIHE